MSSQSKISASKQIGYYLERTARIVKLGFSQAFSRLGLDLTPEQWVVLERLYRKNRQSQTELANASFKDAPTISRILDVLVRKGYVERQRFDNDRRRYMITLTLSGKSVVRKIQPLAEELRMKGWENLDEEDYQTFIRITNQIFDNFDDQGRE
jgi:DNA-binding MarR family transcriptional regulator